MTGYKNRQMKSGEPGGELQTFFFPKHNPPISIKATSLKEAEAKLAELDNDK